MDIIGLLVFAGRRTRSGMTPGPSSATSQSLPWGAPCPTQRPPPHRPPPTPPPLPPPSRCASAGQTARRRSCPPRRSSTCRRPQYKCPLRLLPPTRKFLLRFVHWLFLRTKIINFCKHAIFDYVCYWWGSLALGHFFVYKWGKYYWGRHDFFYLFCFVHSFYKNKFIK